MHRTNPSTEAFLKSLQPADTCVVCTEAFSPTHIPVALDCKHIFGSACIEKWIRTGHGNISACPTCRRGLIKDPEGVGVGEGENGRRRARRRGRRSSSSSRSSRPELNASVIWTAVCTLPPPRLASLMCEIWAGIRTLWRRKADGDFSVTEMLNDAVIPALLKTAERDAILDCYNLIAASWDSVERADRAVGLGVPFVRLVRLMSSAGSVLAKCVTNNARVNLVLWKANACMEYSREKISWDWIVRASGLEDDAYFPLLHAYTMLLSQGIAYSPQPDPWPRRRHEMMNLVVQRCCTKLAQGRWDGRPSNHFKDVLVVVYEELCRYQSDDYSIVLGGHEGEENIVKGIWALAAWNSRKV